LLQDLNAYNEIIFFSQAFYSAHIQRFWGDNADGREVDLWQSRGLEIYVPESSDLCKSTWEVAV
jgi:hypothetical protein